MILFFPFYIFIILKNAKKNNTENMISHADFGTNVFDMAKTLTLDDLRANWQILPIFSALCEFYPSTRRDGKNLV